MAEGWRILVQGGVVLPTDPGPASAFLRASRSGVYTTTRTSDGVSNLLLWERHLARLSESLQFLAKASPSLYPNLNVGVDVKRIVEPSVGEGLTKALELRTSQQEICVSVLLCGCTDKESDPESSGVEVYVHASNYPAVVKDQILPGIRVAVMGPGRILAHAKHSSWASTRQALENVRPSNTREIILSNNGRSLLEGTLTNFFVVKKRDEKIGDEAGESWRTSRQEDSNVGLSDFEVITAPLHDGVLPGVIRQLVIEVCRDAGICLREVAPCWDSRDSWTEAFVTSGLRILQPVQGIQMPSTWTPDLSPQIFEETSWQHCNLHAPGMVTREIHRLVMDRAVQESMPIGSVIIG